MIVEIPALLVDSCTVGGALVIVSCALAAGVTMLDYAFDKVKGKGEKE